MLLAAASAVLRQFDIPRRTMVVLQGESLLNDAVALLLFGIATTAAVQTGGAWTHAVPTLIFAVPAGALDCRPGASSAAWMAMPCIEPCRSAPKCWPS